MLFNCFAVAIKGRITDKLTEMTNIVSCKHYLVTSTKFTKNHASCRCHH